MGLELHSVQELRKFVSPEHVFGVGSRALAGHYARNFGARRVLVVSDANVVKAGWVDDVTAALEAEGIRWSLFTQVTPNPRSDEVRAGAAHYGTEGCDVLVAVGGGSVIDCAKAIGIEATSHHPILDFEGVDQVADPIPPLICIPTTSGSSADVSQFAIISHLAEQRKIAIISKAVVPDIALIDPETLLTMNPHVAASSSVDALVHAIEAFVSNASSPMTDLHALEAMRLLAAKLLPSLEAPDDLELRGQVMLGSLHAGLAFSNASLGCVHAMAHSLGGSLDLPHGECNALLLPHVVSFNFEASTERFRKICAVLGIDLRGVPEGEVRTRLFEHVDSLRRRAGIKDSLALRGVRSQDIPDLAAKAFRDPCIVTNPRRPSIRDIEVIFEEAL